MTPIQFNQRNLESATRRLEGATKRLLEIEEALRASEKPSSEQLEAWAKTRTEVKTASARVKESTQALEAAKRMKLHRERVKDANRTQEVLRRSGVDPLRAERAARAQSRPAPAPARNIAGLKEPWGSK